MQKVREAAARSQSQNNLKQMMLAVHNCYDVNNKIPPCTGAFPNSANGTSWSAPYLPSHYGTQFYFLLPYMEQQNVYNSPEINCSGGCQANSWRSHAIVKTYQAPGDPSLPAGGQTWSGRGATSYAANGHVFRGGWGEDWQDGGVTTFASITDGLSNTIFISERYCICGPNGASTGSQYVQHIWGEDGQGSGPTYEYHHGGNTNFAPSFWAHEYATPNWQSLAGYPLGYVTLPQFGPVPYLTSACDPHRLQAFSPAGLMVGLGDGSVRLVSNGISQITFASAVVPIDGLPLGPDW